MNLNDPPLVGKTLGLTLSALFLIACGGKVFFNGDADGGGGSGANGGNGGNGAQGPGPGPGPTTTGPLPICETLCSEFPTCLGGASDCQDVCNSFYVAGCEAQSEAYLQCVANNLTPECEFPEGACFAEITELENCQSQSNCTTDTCEGGEPNCYCTGTCATEFEEVFLEQSCFGFFGGEPEPSGSTGAAGVGGGGGGGDQPSNEMQCDCYVNGEYITTCFNDSFQCSLEQGCCQQFL